MGNIWHDIKPSRINADDFIAVIEIEKGFKDTGNLWEKYDGNTGEVANQDYKAPTMMGWTAGVYLRFKRRRCYAAREEGVNPSLSQ